MTAVKVYIIGSLWLTSGDKTVTGNNIQQHVRLTDWHLSSGLSANNVN